MNQHIIFFDIDGTLLDHEKKLPDSTREAISKLKENGHEVAIATGRAPFMFSELREELGIDTYISYNGQYVVLNGEVIYRNPLNKDALEALTEMAVSNEHPVVYMDDADMKANVSEHHYINESIATLKIDQFPTHDPHYINRDLYQSLLFCEKGEETIYEQTFDQFDFIRWHQYSVDIIPSGGSKAKGISKLIERIGVSKEYQVAFGDGLNDIEMLEQIGHSFAMGNGHARAKQSAKYITQSVDKYGIEYGLKKLGLI